MLNKNMLDHVIKQVNEINNIELNNCVGKINGLISAYEISDNKEILEESVNQLLLLINKILDESQMNTLIKTTKILGLDEFFIDFIIYLRGLNLSENTIQGYVRAIKRVIEKYNYNSIEELLDNIEKVIDDYSDGKDHKYHNTHLSALKKIMNYIWDIYETKCFFVFYSVNNDNQYKQETFHVDNRNIIDILKMILDFILRKKNAGITQIYVTYSDKKRKVPDYIFKQIELNKVPNIIG